MLRISKLTDYSTVIMHQLALAPDRLYSANELAEKTRLSPPTVSKILKILQDSQLVDSMRGAHGGYQLARPANEISVTEIIRAMEGHLALTECSVRQGICTQENSCMIKHNWQLINRIILAALESISLADMTKPLTTHALFNDGIQLTKYLNIIEDRDNPPH